jgi:single-strand DNA-binding protein
MPATIVLTGRLARDPETRTTRGGTTVTNLTIPVDTGYGESKLTTWWKVTLFGKRADTAGRHLRKGAWVSVTGTPAVETYTKRDGTQGFSPAVNADGWDFVGAKPQDAPQDAPQEYRPAPAPDYGRVEMSDVPF